MLTKVNLSKYEMTIGIECHVQLATASKLFSGADNDARGKLPNTVVSPIDYALPGMLPVLNWKAIELAIRAGIALGSEVAEISRFDCKHYFYPDLPKGYQTTQMYQPIIGAGIVTTQTEDGEEIPVRIHHAHLEEDAGKLTHYSDHSLVDLNRAGTPLIEIVSEPDIHSPQQAKAYATELYRLMTFAGVTHGDLYHGNMRFDVNISIALKGADELGTRAEVKNLNSFKSVERAAEYEFERQVEMLEKGERIVQETRGWDEAKQKTVSQRSKEDAQDYRYMPDADIPPVILTPDDITSVKDTMPLLPDGYRHAWKDLKISVAVRENLLSSQRIAQFILQVQQQSSDESATRVAHWFNSAVAPGVKLDVSGLTVDPFVELVDMVTASELSSTAAKEVFNELLLGASSPRAVADERNLLQLVDESAIVTVVEEVLADPKSQKAIADIKAGNDKVIGFLVGQVMKLSQGKANPATAQKIIRSKIAE